MELADLGIPEGLEDFDPEEFERELNQGSSSSTSRNSSSSGDSLGLDDNNDDNSGEGESENIEIVLTEEDLIRGRNERYGRRRSQSIDYGSRGSGNHEFEQTPEQALISKSEQLLQTIPRFQYEAPSWVPDLLQVQDTPEEINAEEMYDYKCEIIPIEIQDKQYVDYVDYRVGILGDVGVGKTFLLQSYIKKADSVTTVATNGVDYTEQYVVKENVCNRFIFCDFSGQERLYPILKAYMKSLQAAIIVIDMTDPATLQTAISFYLPTLKQMYDGDFLVYIALNKYDMKPVIKKRTVSYYCKTYFPNAVLIPTGKGMKKNTSSLFRGIMKNLLVEKNDESCNLFM